ncbi:phosphate uptake regulator PhoU [Candidatus Woesearchaeota archaeon]|nr:phosphate uptake regulator PhoU [Candidatus Woesearchaeota archaeon]
MEQRRLIRFGSNSHVLSMPSYWLKKNKLVKGDFLYVREGINGDLVISNDLKIKKHLKSIIISADDKQIERVSREILAAYINNYDTIKIIGKNLNKIMSEIRRILHSFVALEIIEEDDKKIVAKDFLNMGDVSVSENIRRMDIIIRGMMGDMRKCVYENCSDSVYQRDFDVNRFSFLLMRAVNGAIEDPNIAKLLNVKSSELMLIRILSVNLEDIGDEVKRVSRFLGSHDLDDKLKKSLMLLLSDVENAYLNVMKAYYTKDVELAFEVDFWKDGFVERCNKLYDKYPVSGFARILERLKKMSSGISNLAWVIYSSGFENEKK